MTLAQQFMLKSGWEYKEVNDQFNVKVCPLCGDDRWKFYMDRNNGLWDCKLCGENGNLYQLRGKLGGLSEISKIQDLFINKTPIDESVITTGIEELHKDKSILDYLKNTRGFTEETIAKFKLGNDHGWLMIPHYENGKCWNIKYRNVADKKFRRVQGQPSILFNIDNIDKTKNTLVIVESETDCIAAVQMGIKNVVGLTVGAASFAPEWIPYTLQFKTIYICLNSDLPGREGARKIAEKLGFYKCRNVLLPEKDVNEFLLHHKPEEFKELLKNAKKFDIQNIAKLEEYIKKLDNWFDEDGSLSGLQLPFRRVNDILKGFKIEDLIILSGDTGVGKTTLSLNIILNFIQQGHRCLGFFLEGKIMYYILRMMSIVTRKKIDNLKDNPEEWENLKKQFSDYPLYFYSGSQADLNTYKLSELLKAAVKLYDIDFVLIDNLQKFVKDDREVVHQISMTVSILKDLAVDLKIPILLIAHPRKVDKGQRISMHDAKSSSTIYQDADVYLIINNDKKDVEDEDDISLIIEKNRMGEGGVAVDMIFERDVAIYREREYEFDGKPSNKHSNTKSRDINSPADI